MAYYGAPAQLVAYYIQASKTYDASFAGANVHRSHSANMSDVLPAASSVGSSFFLSIHNDTTAKNLVLSVASSGFIDGLSSLTIYPGQTRLLRSTGATWITDPGAVQLGPFLYSFNADALTARSTNGCTFGTFSSATYFRTLTVAIFDNATEQGGCGHFTLPNAYDGGPIGVRFHHVETAGSAGDGLTWGISGACIADGASLDVAYGSLLGIAEVVPALNVEQISAYDNFTPSNAAAGTSLYFEVKRLVPGGSHANPAKLIRIDFLINLVRPNDNP